MERWVNCGRLFDDPDISPMGPVKVDVGSRFTEGSWVGCIDERCELSCSRSAILTRVDYVSDRGFSSRVLGDGRMTPQD